ncbi:MAG: multi-sensor signal transduction multi-kinase, partial [Labilithrix sp.]|nr:multi-sensor signal transduction multi-kinase [Labilithrix sp.]
MLLRERATLWADDEVVLSRCVGEPGESLLVVTPASTSPTPTSLARLEHEYALRDELDPAWSARPREIARDQGRIALVLADPGGELLATCAGKFHDIGVFLRFATGLAVALGKVHARGLVHKDIRPTSILVDATTGDVWFHGFGVASRLLRERRSAASSAVAGGTLAYMAPEQTGRMNRSIDARSDLYAVGVLFYELLAGSLPFNASEPLEWIHCHMARQPVPLTDRRGSIP